MNETLKKSDYRVENTHRSLGQPKEDGKNFLPPEKHDGTRHPKTVTVDDKNMS